MEATGRRRKRERNYVTIENAMFHDERLSWKAKGLLGYLLTKPDGWIVRITDLTNHGTDGEKSIRSGIKELRECGYLNFHQTKKPNGKWGKMVWEYDDIPFESDSPEILDIEPFESNTQNGATAKPPISQNRHAENGHAENGVAENRVYISNDLSVSNPDLYKFNKDYQSIMPQIVSMAEKILGPNIKTDRLDNILFAYYYFYEKLTIMDLQRILLGAKKTFDTKKIKNFQTYLYKSFDNAIKQIEIAQNQERMPERTEILPDWFDEEQEPNTGVKKDSEVSDEERAELEEILKSLKN